MSVSECCFHSLLLFWCFHCGLSQGMKHTELHPLQAPLHPEGQKSHAGTSADDGFLSNGKQSETYGFPWPKVFYLLASISAEALGLTNELSQKHQISHSPTLRPQSSLLLNETQQHAMHNHGPQLQERPGLFIRKSDQPHKPTPRKPFSILPSKTLHTHHNDENRKPKDEYDTHFRIKVTHPQQGKPHSNDEKKHRSKRHPKKSPPTDSLGDLDEIWRTHEVPHHDKQFYWPSKGRLGKHHPLYPVKGRDPSPQGRDHPSKHFWNETLKSKSPTEGKSGLAKLHDSLPLGKVPYGPLHGVKTCHLELKNGKIHPEFPPTRNHPIIEHPTNKIRDPRQDIPHSSHIKAGPPSKISNHSRKRSSLKAPIMPNLQLRKNKPTFRPQPSHRPGDNPASRPQPGHVPTKLLHRQQDVGRTEQLHEKPDHYARHSRTNQPKVEITKETSNKEALRLHLEHLREKNLANILYFLFQFKKHVIQNEKKRSISLPNLVQSFKSGSINAMHGRLHGLSSIRVDGRISIKMRINLKSNPPNESSMERKRSLSVGRGANYTHIRMPIFINKLALLYDRFKVSGPGKNESTGRANITIQHVKLVLQFTIYRKPSSNHCEFALDNTYFVNTGKAVVKLSGVKFEKEFEKELIQRILWYIERPKFIRTLVSQTFRLFLADFEGECIYS